MKTRLTELLGIKYPIIQGAMAWVSDGVLAGEVSKQGGAGVIATGGREISWVKEQINIAKTITNNPFGINIMLMAKNCDEMVELAIEEKLSFVTLGAGNPLPYFEKLKSGNVKVIPVVPNVKLSKRMAENHADAIIIEGMEAGGHIGKISTLALMTQVIPEVDIPVIAAGGFSDGRGLAAALTMGAEGIQMGTRFYASLEANVDKRAKQAIVDASDVDSVVTGYLHNHAVRGLRNRMTDKYLEMERKGASEEELLEVVVGTSKRAPLQGDVEWGFVQSGQSLSVIKEIKSCKEIMEDIIVEAKESLKKANRFLD